MEWTKDRITGVPAANTCSEMENSAVGQHPEDFAPTHKTNRDYQPTSHNKKVNPHFEGSPFLLWLMPGGPIATHRNEAYEG